MSEPDVLIDSDVLIEILRGAPKAANWLENHASYIIGIPVLVRMEILQGARNKQEQLLLSQELRHFPVIHLESDDSERALSWFEMFHLSHGLGVIDCLIAATAVRLQKPLYTFNIKHYRPIEQLNVREPYSH